MFIDPTQKKSGEVDPDEVGLRMFPEPDDFSKLEKPVKDSHDKLSKLAEFNNEFDNALGEQIKGKSSE